MLFMGREMRQEAAAVFIVVVVVVRAKEAVCPHRSPITSSTSSGACVLGFQGFGFQHRVCRVDGLRAMDSHGPWTCTSDFRTTRLALTFVASERPQARGIHSAKDRLQCRAVGPVDEGARAAGVEVQKAMASPSAQPQALNIQPYCRTSVLPTKTLKRQTGAGKGLQRRRSMPSRSWEATTWQRACLDS